MDRVRKLIGLSQNNGKRLFGELTGKGVGVAIIDTGIFPHADFGIGMNCRIKGFRDFVNNKNSVYDDCGHGTHVAGVIGGSGIASKGRCEGIAPDCHIVMAKALNHMGNGKINDVLAAIDWICQIKNQQMIRVVNISIGATVADKYDEDSVLALGVEKLWDNGLVVCVAAGNNGPNKNSITMPGICRNVITVGSVDDDTPAIMDRKKTVNYSGRGPTKNAIIKPEVVAPGSNVMSCANSFRGYAVKSGTSMSTPVVSGCIALLLQKYPQLSNYEVKKYLKTHLKKIEGDKSKNGWGAIDVTLLLA